MKATNILVLDDDQSTGSLEARILQQEGYLVDRVESGVQALKLLEKKEYQIAFLDIRLPDISGLEVLKSIKESGHRTEVIMQTAFASLDNTIEALNRGALSYIIKPFKPQEVRLAARRALAKLRLEEENRNLLESLKKQNQELKEAYSDLKNRTSQLIDSEKQAALQVLGGGIAHELNNPLTSILGLTDLLRLQEESGSERHRKLDQIRQETKRCAGIVRDLLTFSRQTSGKREAVDVNLILLKTRDIIKRRAEAEGVRVEVKTAEHLPRVAANPGRLGQLFLNLFLNALEAVGGAKTPAVVVQTSGSNGSVLVEFEDTGRGIPPESIEHIFEPFFTGEKKEEAIGMGLTVCQGIVESIGGDITVESRPGKGSVFRVRLPGESNSGNKRAKG